MRSLRPMKRSHASLVIAAAVTASMWAGQSFAKAVGHKDGTSVRFISEYRRHDVRVTSVCAEGHVVLVAHSDVGQGGGLQMIQLQNTVDGAIIPMTCDLNEFAAD